MDCEWASTFSHSVFRLTYNWQCAFISLDYKLNFTPEHPERIPEIHQRVADLMYNLFTENGGLYIKIGMYISSPANSRC